MHKVIIRKNQLLSNKYFCRQIFHIFLCFFIPGFAHSSNTPTPCVKMSKCYRLTCPSFTSLKQYLNPDCWLYVPPPLSVCAWIAPIEGAGAPADPEDEEEKRLCREGADPETLQQRRRKETRGQETRWQRSKESQRKSFRYLQDLMDLHTGLRGVLHSDLYQGRRGGRCTDSALLNEALKFNTWVFLSH